MTTSYINQCRICLEYGAVYPIFESKDDSQSVYSKLTLCIQEKIEDIEIFPRSICDTCYNILDIVYNFVKKYKQTHEILKNNIPFIDNEKIEKDEKCFIEIKTESHQADVAEDSHFDDHDNELNCSNDEEVLIVKVENAERKTNCNVPKILQKLPNITVKKKLGNETLTEEKLLVSPKNKNVQVSLSKKLDNVKHNKQLTGSKSMLKRPVTHLEKSIIEKYILGKNIDSSSPRRPIAPKKVNTPKKRASPKEIAPKEPYCRLCELCGAAFHTKDRYSQHKRTHITDPRNICPQCNQEFQTRYQLRKHKEKAHTDLYKYVCDHCGLSFYYSKNLITHLQKGHSEDGSSKKTYECTTCGKNYKSSEILKRHIREVHLGLPPPKRRTTCSFCGQEFRSYKSLRTHKRKEHLYQHELKSDVR